MVTKQRSRETAAKQAPKKVNTSKFVRTQPLGMKANEIVAAAKQQGVTLSVAHVYTIRAAAKKNAGGLGRTPAARSGQSWLSDEDAVFKKAVLDIGLKQARELVTELEQSFQALARA